MKRPLSYFIIVLILAVMVPAVWSASLYTQRLEDSKAVYATAPSGADDTASLQQAINKVQETTGQGIVLLGPGQYRVSNTIYIWPGIRLIGYGATRPVIVLPAESAGVKDESREKVLFFLAGGRPRNTNGGTRPVNDANPGTFYSAMSNVDIEIEAGNFGAVAVRSRYAQHCFLAHMEMRLGSGLAVDSRGNVFIAARTSLYSVRVRNAGR
jgi:hypothetical protein